MSDKETLDVWLKQFPWIWVCSRTKKTSSDIYKVLVSVVPFFDRMLTNFGVLSLLPKCLYVNNID